MEIRFDCEFDKQVFDVMSKEEFDGIGEHLIKSFAQYVANCERVKMSPDWYKGINAKVPAEYSRIWAEKDSAYKDEKPKPVTKTVTAYLNDDPKTVLHIDEVVKSDSISGIIGFYDKDGKIKALINSSELSHVICE